MKTRKQKEMITQLAERIFVANLAKHDFTEDKSGDPLFDALYGSFDAAERFIDFSNDEENPFLTACICPDCKKKLDEAAKEQNNQNLN